MQHLQSNSLLQGGKYKIEKVLGQGGFGITYLAEQPMLHRKVAVKEFFMKEHCNREESTSMVSVPSIGSRELVDKFKAKFIKEASMIASMSNHHIVSIYDIFEENGTAYYIMEFMNGGSMDELVKKGALAEADALKYTREIADALDYIHRQNVLHLDIKPANILLRDNGEAVIIDFGISKRYDDEGGQTSTTPTGISKGYAPVEQYNQGLTNFSPATDIYSLGATLYKMLTGVTPPEASLLLDEEEELVRPANVSFSTWVAVEKAMEPRRKRRPQSISEFLSLLGDVSTAKTTKNVQNAVPASEETQIIVPTVKDEFKPGNTSQRTETTENVVFDVNGVSFKMIKVEGGTFDMKEKQSSGFFGMNTKEVIQRTTLSDYYIGETQVTQALWKAIMGENPSDFKGDNLPVDSVSWNDCQDFINKLNNLTGKKFRLPTEAEWEFAAKGGNKSQGYEYSGSTNIEDVAWHGDNSGSTTHDVASKQPNELGIYDMGGNVWEWCADLYGNYSDSPQVNPTGPDSGTYYVIRGGCWKSAVRFCCSSARSFSRPSFMDCTYGLRLALSE